MDTFELPPLVEPGDDLTSVDVERHTRQMIIPELGVTGQARLRAARVAIVGAGGLGSPVIQYLTAAGIGHIRIIDDDVVEMSNLHRQIIHGEKHVGWPKSESAAETVRFLDSSVGVIPVQVRFSMDNAETLLGGADVVVDASDNFETRYAISDACAQFGIPVVWGAVLGLDAQVSTFWSAPPESSGAPALTLRDLFPEPPAAGTVPTGRQAGVIGAVCGMTGSMMAMEAIKLICGFGTTLLGRVAVVDAFAGEQSVIELAPVSPGTAAAKKVVAPEPPNPEVEIGIDELAAMVDGQRAPRILDVRPAVDRARGWIPGSESLPFTDLPARLDELAEYPAPLVVYCQAQVLSRLAREMLTSRRDDVRELSGGFVAWRASGAPIEAYGL